MRRLFSVLFASLLVFPYDTVAQTMPDTTSTKLVGLKEVTVRGSRKGRIVYRLDRQRLSADAVQSADGGTAADVLSATPSVRVSSDGDISFRGSTGFKVYIDGKPAPTDGAQALHQIPAANIADIEILTTPSARYRTDGDAGIINIITKTGIEAAPASNILVNLLGGTQGSWGSDITLNYHKGRHRWWAGGTLQEVKSKSDFIQDKTTDFAPLAVNSHSDGTRFLIEGTFTARAGWEFAPSKNHLASLELEGGTTKRTRGGDMLYDERRLFLSPTANSIEQPTDYRQYDSRDRYILEKNLWQATANYAWHINPHRDMLTLQSRFRYDNYSKEYTESNLHDRSTGQRFEGTRGFEVEHHWDCDATAAYTHAFAHKGKLETGAQYTTYSEHGQYNFYAWEHPAQAFNWQEDIYAPFYYRRQILSAFAMANQSLGAWQYDIGLRAERTIDRMDIAVTNASRHRQHNDIFPSAHLSYTFANGLTLSGGYSARINRPGIWQLEPYITYEDYYTKKIGNPDVRSEYIDAYEVSLRRSFGSRLTTTLTAFHRNRRDVLDIVRVPSEPGVTLDSLVNTGNDRIWGLELNAVYQPMHPWRLTLNGSLYHYDFNARYDGCADALNTSYTLALLQNIALTSSASIQFDSHLVGPTTLTQGRERSYFYFDLGYRQHFLGKRLSISLTGRDILHTARYRNRRAMSGLASTTYVRPIYPAITLSVSYALNLKGSKAESREKHVNHELFEGKNF